MAVAGLPDGPFVKSPLNPLINTGHETCLFPYGEGVAAMVTRDGPEKNTIQYAPDGLSFETKSHVVSPPVAGGPFCHDLYADNADGRGITWGLSHVVGKGGCFVVCFDCALSRGVDATDFGRSNIRLAESAFFQQSMVLSQEWPGVYLRQQLDTDRETIVG